MLLLFMLIALAAIYIAYVGPAYMGMKKAQRELKQTIYEANHPEETNAKEDAYNKRYDEFCSKYPIVKQYRTAARAAESEWTKSKLGNYDYLAYGLSVNIAPTQPTYTRGLYKGSIGDNISVLSNAQKKEDYEKALAKYNDAEAKKRRALSKSRTEAQSYYEALKRLINELEKISGSKEFLNKETRELERVERELNY